MDFAVPKKNMFPSKTINASIKLPRACSGYYRFLLMALPMQEFGNFATSLMQNN